MSPLVANHLILQAPSNAVFEMLSIPDRSEHRNTNGIQKIPSVMKQRDEILESNIILNVDRVLNIKCNLSLNLSIIFLTLLYLRLSILFSSPRSNRTHRPAVSEYNMGYQCPTTIIEAPTHRSRWRAAIP